jgi:hypothetical protein
MNDAPRYEDFKAAPLARIKGIADFLREYEPINYTIDGLLPGGSIYGVTAKRGAGKTAFLTSTALAVATGDEKILGLEVEKGRVAYIILENPTDFRMKLSVTAFLLGIDVQAINDRLVILDMRLPHAQIMELLKRDADRFGPFQLACYDTFQAGFAGANFNDNADTLKHAQSLREFTTLPGKPSTLVACHPIKNAVRDNLEPYGGGSTMNEFDGNLTLWNDGGSIELSHNKVRGPEFEPLHFRIEKIGSPDILDNKGRQPLLPVMRRVSEQAVEDKRKVEVNKDAALLLAMADDPTATQRDLAAKLKIGQATVNRKQEAFIKDKLIIKAVDGAFRFTKKGNAEVETLRSKKGIE